MRRTIHAILLGVAILLGIGVAGGSAALAGTPPSGTNLPVAITITPATIALQMSTTQLSISTQPGMTGHSNPVSYSVTSQDTAGYDVVVSAPDLTGTSTSLPASALTDSWSVAPGASGGTMSGNTPLSSSPVKLYNSSGLSNAGNGTDAVTENWSLAVPGTQTPGNLSTLISYVAEAH
jgi:hypothetical protein